MFNFQNWVFFFPLKVFVHSAPTPMLSKSLTTHLSKSFILFSYHAQKKLRTITRAQCILTDSSRRLCMYKQLWDFLFYFYPPPFSLSTGLLHL